MKPKTTSIPRWKVSSLGTPIGLSLSHSLEDLVPLRPVLLIGGVHGDEPEGVRLAQDTLKWLKNAQASGTHLVPWVVIPCLNVDGYQNKTRGNAKGIDLNRNYPSVDWSPDCSDPRYNPGPAPGSEVEIQAVVELVTNLRPRLMIHCHSWNPCIVATGIGAQKDGQRLASSSGYPLQGDIGYPTPGSLSRYGWHDNLIPVICIEEQEHLADQSTIWPRFAPGMAKVFTDLSPRHLS